MYAHLGARGVPSTPCNAMQLNSIQCNAFVAMERLACCRSLSSHWRDGGPSCFRRASQTLKPNKVGWADHSVLIIFEGQPGDEIELAAALVSAEESDLAAVGHRT